MKTEMITDFNQSASLLIEVKIKGNIFPEKSLYGYNNLI